MYLSRRALIAAGLTLLDVTTAQAATFPLRTAGNWPQKPVKFIIPNAPGSSVDTIGRLLMIEMAKSLQQAAVADNKAGAAGALGAETARISSPDGYTLLIGSTTAISTAPLLQKAVRYDPLVDFELISLVALLPNVLVCNPALPIKTTRDLIAYAKSKGDKSNMASAGVGSAGFTSLHVPYKGGSQGVTSVVSGETDWVLTPAPAAMSLVASDRLRLLGHSLPVGAAGVGVAPSLAATVPGFEFAGWIGLLAPKGLASVISTALAETVQKTLQAREVIQAFETNGAVPYSSTSAEFRRFLERDIATNKKVIAIAGIQAE